MTAWADRAFVSAIEKRYLAYATDRTATWSDVSVIHRAALAEAIYRADRTNGGVRYRALDPVLRRELEKRLREFVERRATSPV